MKTVAGGAIISRGLWEEALALGFDRDPRVAFRASWALEWAYFTSREGFAPHTEAFLENFCRVTNSSAHRHYTKIMYDMLRRGFAPAPEWAARIAEQCFDMLIDPRGKIAVKVWAMDILDLLSRREEWVAHELRETLRSQMAGASAGFVKRAQAILKR